MDQNPPPTPSDQTPIVTPSGSDSNQGQSKAPKTPLISRLNSTTGRILLVVVVLCFIVSGYKLTHFSHASSCTVSAILVNSCRPWLGAAVLGSPRAASDQKSQVLYFEQSIGRPLDVVHFYNPVGEDTLSTGAVYFAERANTYLYQNWKGPTSQWGNIASYNSGIDSMAASIKSLGSKKIFLTYWHEPENDVSPGGDPNCPNLAYKGSSGTVSQYRAAWAYIENRFAADGVTNVVWVMNYMGYQAWDCLVPDMWPGNNLVDWVTFDSGYSVSDNETWSGNVGRFYDVLEKDNSTSTNFESKPWGLAEWGACTDPEQSHVYDYYTQAKAALDSNTFPRLHMYMSFNSTSGPGAGLGCLTNYSSSGSYDPTEQTYFNHFADDSIFSTSISTSTPSPTPSPTPPNSTPSPTPRPTPSPTPSLKPSPTPSPPSATVVSLGTSSDTYVDSASPTSNFGSITPLHASNVNNRAFIRFKTGGVTPSGSSLSSVQLKLYVVQNSSASGALQVHPENDSWVAANVTWNTQPSWNNAVIATSSTPKTGSWITVSLPVGSINLSGDTSLALTYSVANADLELSSREDAAHPPALTLTFVK